MTDYEQKDFDQWNEVKKYLNANLYGSNAFPKSAEVWMCVLGKNIGFEQNGGGSNFSRPVLVVKKFNNQMFWVIPLSTKQKNLDFYFNYTDPNLQKVSAVLAQLKLISIKRFKRKMYELPPETFAQIKEKLRLFIS